MQQVRRAAEMDTDGSIQHLCGGGWCRVNISVDDPSSQGPRALEARSLGCECGEPTWILRRSLGMCCAFQASKQRMSLPKLNRSTIDTLLEPRRLGDCVVVVASSEESEKLDPYSVLVMYT